MPRPLAAILVALALLALAGCGSSGSTSGGSTPGKPSQAEIERSQAEAEKGAKATARSAKAAEESAPKGASRTLRGIYRAFPAPSKGSLEPAARKAVAAGEAACRGKTPVQVKEEFYAAAKRYLEPEQAKMIGRIASFERQAATEQGFVAGQLAADTYAATLSEEAARPGYQGCVYSLARQVEKQLAPGSQ
ncbi:MAG: hypothetical protein JSU06_01340 [Actinobacteria bacterium]|nr:hypothetical protein [Actinomycetota bacterium]